MAYLHNIIWVKSPNTATICHVFWKQPHLHFTKMSPPPHTGRDRTCIAIVGVSVHQDFVPQLGRLLECWKWPVIATDGRNLAANYIISHFVFARRLLGIVQNISTGARFPWWTVYHEPSSKPNTLSFCVFSEIFDHPSEPYKHLMTAMNPPMTKPDHYFYG